MINSQELRLGNWFSNGEKYYKLDASSFYDIATGITDYLCEPIPLSPEILEKCGFELVVELHPTYLIGRGAIVLYLTKQSDVYWHCIVYNNYEDELSEKHAGIGIFKYLHQLQNLYYVLTGTELEVKL